FQNTDLRVPELEQRLAYRAVDGQRADLSHGPHTEADVQQGAYQVLLGIVSRDAALEYDIRVRRQEDPGRRDLEPRRSGRVGLSLDQKLRACVVGHPYAASLGHV